MDAGRVRLCRAAVLTAALAITSVAAQDRSARTLDIYLVDVEGGNATLFVSPSRESLLIDTGNGGQAATLDADRIMAAARDAGLTQIDHLITAHDHGDHFGAMAELASRIPIREFIDALPVHNGPAFWLRISAREDGPFTVTHTRNGFAKTYPVP